MRPVAPPTCSVLPVSSSRCTRSMPIRTVSPSTSTSSQPSTQSGSSYWLILKFFLRANRHHAAIRQLSASPMRMVASIAALFATGRLPGSPRQTGQTCVLGSAPNPVGQPQNILVRVPSSTWVSKPMTGSNRAITSSKLTRVAVIDAPPLMGPAVGRTGPRLDLSQPSRPVRPDSRGFPAGRVPLTGHDGESPRRLDT